MEDKIIANCEVTEIKRVAIRPTTFNPNPLDVVASVLKLEPINPPDPRLAVHGTMTIPFQLPFGEKYQVIIRSMRSVPGSEEGRLFKEDE